MPKPEFLVSVQAFEVLKLCVDMEFKLWNVPTKRVTKSEIARSGPDEILEVSSVPNLLKRRAIITWFQRWHYY